MSRKKLNLAILFIAFLGVMGTLGYLALAKKNEVPGSLDVAVDSSVKISNLATEVYSQFKADSSSVQTAVSPAKTSRKAVNAVAFDTEESARAYYKNRTELETYSVKNSDTKTTQYTLIRTQDGSHFVEETRTTTVQNSTSTQIEYYDAGVMMVVRPKNLSYEKALEIVKSYGGTVYDDAFDHSILMVKLPELSARGVQDAAAYFAKTEVTPSINYVMYPQAGSPTPNDELYNDFTGFTNWQFSRLNASAAWEMRTGTADEIIIGIVDGGLSTTHPDLVDNLWTNPGEIPNNKKDDDGNGYVDDVHGVSFFFENNTLKDTVLQDHTGHGTAVAGIIGARGNNTIGSTGLAQECRIVCAGAKTTGGYTAQALVKAFEYVSAQKAKVVNFSVGGSTDIPGLKAVFEKMRDSGIIIVCAAGNAGTDNDVIPQYPPNYGLDNMIVVGWMARMGGLGSGANYGAKTVNIAAPGDQIWTTYYYSETQIPDLAPAERNAYLGVDGSSLAAPHVTGVAAMVWSQDTKQTYRDVIERIYAGGKANTAWANRCTTGKELDFYGAMTAKVDVLVQLYDITATRGTSKDYVEVSWRDISTPLETYHYKVYRADTEDGAMTLLNATATPEGTYHDRTAVPGRDYYYTVKAIKQ